MYRNRDAFRVKECFKLTGDMDRAIGDPDRMIVMISIATREYNQKSNPVI